MGRDKEPVSGAVYHLRRCDCRPTALCSANAPPERTVRSPGEIPHGGRLCLRCVRRLRRLPITKAVPRHLAVIHCDEPQ